MPTSRSPQAHERRVEKIAEEAADKIAADAPDEVEVVVTVDEVPQSESRASSRRESGNGVAPALPVEAIADATVIFVERVSAAQLRFAARMMSAVFAGSA